MAKLRKMLGRVDEPNIVELMAVIETQSRETLSAWALDWAENHFLEIYEKYDAEDLRLRSLVDVCRECLEGERPLKEIKPFLKEAPGGGKGSRKKSGGPGGGAGGGDCMRGTPDSDQCPRIYFLRRSGPRL